jgi:hypothetical protein
MNTRNLQHTRINCRKLASLTMSAVSSTFRAHCSMHSEKSAISLSLKVLLFNRRLARNRFRSGIQSDPCISSVCNCDHDYYFELLVTEEQDAQSISRCFYCTPWRYPGCPACEPNLLHC